MHAFIYLFTPSFIYLFFPLFFCLCLSDNISIRLFCLFISPYCTPLAASLPGLALNHIDKDKKLSDQIRPWLKCFTVAVAETVDVAKSCGKSNHSNSSKRTKTGGGCSNSRDNGCGDTGCT